MYTIYLTTKCNFRCSYCYENYQNQQSMSYINLKKTIDYIMDQESNRNVSIGFMGGEPLLEKDLIRYTLHYISENYSERIVKYYLTTNGLLLDSDFLEQIKKYDFQIRLSFDGTKKSHDMNRKCKIGGSEYLNIFKRVLEIRDSDIPYSIRMTIPYNTIPYIYENIVFLHENNLDPINMIFDVNLELNDNEIDVLESQMNQVKEYFLSEIDKNNKIIIDQFNGRFMSLLCDYGNHFSMCDAGITNFKIMPNGEIYPCGFLTNEKQYKIGNIGSPIDINISKKIALSLYDTETDKCKECNIKDFCSSMKCGYKNYLSTGKINVPSETTCKIEKLLYPLVKSCLIHLSEINYNLLEVWFNYIKSQDLKLSQFGEDIQNSLKRSII